MDYSETMRPASSDGARLRDRQLRVHVGETLPAEVSPFSQAGSGRRGRAGLGFQESHVPVQRVGGLGNGARDPMGIRLKYLVTNRVYWEIRRILNLYRKCWAGTETFHRDGKQHPGMGDCPLRTAEGQTRHLNLVMLTHSLLIAQMGRALRVSGLIVPDDPRPCPWGVERKTSPEIGGCGRYRSRCGDRSGGPLFAIRKIGCCCRILHIQSFITYFHLIPGFFSGLPNSTCEPSCEGNLQAHSTKDRT